MQSADAEFFETFCVTLIDQLKLTKTDDEVKIHKVLESAIHKHFSQDLPNPTTRDTIYLAAALADELFLNTDWTGKKYWEEHMLEFQFFKTQIAGEIVHQRISEILHSDTTNTEMAKRYLIALSLGFVGKYRATDKSDEIIHAIRSQLYDLIERFHKKIYRPEHKLFQEQYASTLPTMHRKLLPDFDNVIYGCILFVCAFFVISSAVWVIETHDINKLITEIQLIAVRE